MWQGDTGRAGWMALHWGRSSTQPPLLNKTPAKLIHNHLAVSQQNRWLVHLKTSFSGLNSNCMVTMQQTTQGSVTGQRVTQQHREHESKAAWILLTQQRKAHAGAVKCRNSNMGTLGSIDQILKNTSKKKDSGNSMLYSLFCTNQQSLASPGKPL